MGKTKKITADAPLPVTAHDDAEIPEIVARNGLYGDIGDHRMR